MQRWITDRRLHAMFAELLELEPSRRQEYFERNCGDDPELEGNLKRMLEASEAPDEFLRPGGALDGPIWDELATTSNSHDPRSQQRIGAYDLVEVIGDGGMATVYLADRADGLYEQHVALKLVHLGSINEEVVRRFDQERQILANLNHPNIARLIDGGVAESGAPYLVMEHVPGESIVDYCDNHRFKIEQRLHLFLDVARAVGYAHQNLVLHLDIKPSNILVTPEGVPKLLDFGIAKLLDPGAGGPSAPLTRASSRPMTLEYASPEQIAGETLTTASDVFQLGVLLYRLLTGQSPLGVEQARLGESHPLSSAVARADPVIARNQQTTRNRLENRLRGDLDTIVFTTLRKNPERRYSTVRQLIEDIERHLAHQPVTARPDTVFYRVGRFARRNVAGVTATFVVLSLVTGLTAFYASRLTDERDRAQIEASKSEQVAGFLVELFNASDPHSNFRGTAVTARELLDTGAERIESELAAQPEVQASLAYTIGSIYGNQGLLDKAEGMLDKSLATQRAVLGSDHPDTLKTMGELGIVYWRQGRYRDAEDLNRELVDLATTVFGETHYLTLRFLNNLGLNVWRQSRFEEALVIHEDVLATRLRVLGEEHRDIVSSYNNLAGVYLMQGRLGDAADFYTKALDLGRRILGSDHPSTMDALNNLAMAHLDLGQYTKAEPLFEEAIELRQAILGDDHPRTIASMNNLATVYMLKGMYENAEALYLKCLESRRDSLGEDHQDTLWSIANLGELYEAQGRHEEAEVLHNEAYSRRREILGESHIDTLRSMRSLAGLYERNSLFENAESMYRDVLDRLYSEYAPDFTDTIKAQRDFGRMLTAQGQLAEAATILEDAVSRARNIASQDQFLLATTLVEYGLCLTKQENFEQAESALLESLESLDATPGSKDEETKIALRYTADLYDAWNKPIQAASYRAKLENVEGL